MPRKKLKIPNGYQPDLDWALVKLRDVLDAVNGPEIKVKRPGATEWRRRSVPHCEMELELRRLIEVWRSTGKNLNKLFQREPGLEAKLRHGKTTLYVTRYGEPHLDWEPEIPQARSPKQEAIYYFAHLITNPLAEQFQGPCPRCERYFLAETNRPRKYCSKKCGTATTAAEAVRQFRERQYRRKVEQAQKWITKWNPKSTRKPCKDWIASRTPFSKKWLTQAERRGRLVFPNINECKN